MAMLRCERTEKGLVNRTLEYGETLHGGGQGFESPRLHSENIAFCRVKEAEMGAQFLPVAYSTPVRFVKGMIEDKLNKALEGTSTVTYRY